MLCVPLRPPSRLRVPPTFRLTRRREDAKSLVEVHAIEVKGNRHLTFLPTNTHKDILIDRFE